jgi:hypothetical protein
VLQHLPNWRNNLNEIEIPVEPVVAPYIKHKRAAWPALERGATILDNVHLRVSADKKSKVDV